MYIGNFPRIRLANLPTPLNEMAALSRRFGGPKLFVKRDDLTGLAFGGNKTRKLEYVMADAINKRADVIVTGAGIQSNWCTQTIAAAVVTGLKTVLVPSGPIDGFKPEEYGGNTLLHYILGAEVRTPVKTWNEIPEALDKVANELKRKGHNPYIAEFAGSTPIGIMGYVNASLELSCQALDRGIKIDYIVVPSGSGGTQAGLVLGNMCLNANTKVLGISVSYDKDKLTRNVAQLVNKGAHLLNVDAHADPKDIEVFDQYAAEGYGIVNKETVEAIKLVAQTEGILLDPVYTGKAMAGLIDLIQKDYFTKGANVVFIHTGGAFVLSSYREPIKSIMESKEPPWTKPPWSQ